MALLIILSNRAEDDLIEASAYYQAQSPGLGLRFIKKVNEALDNLSLFNQYPVRYDDVRIKQVDVFPFPIHYVINEKEGLIEVDTIMHGRRDSPIR